VQAPADVWRVASRDLAQLVGDKMDALRSAQAGTAAHAMSRMREYRDYRLEVMFMEEKPLDEQLKLLKQRLNEPGHKPLQSSDSEFIRE